MNFKPTDNPMTLVMYGAALAVVLGVIGLIPCVGAVNCLLGPIAYIALGYLLVSGKDLVDSAVKSFIAALGAAVVTSIFAALKTLLAGMIGIGSSMFSGSENLLGNSLGTGFSLVASVIFGFFGTLVIGGILIFIGRAIKIYAK